MSKKDRLEKRLEKKCCRSLHDAAEKILNLAVDAREDDGWGWAVRRMRSVTPDSDFAVWSSQDHWAVAAEISQNTAPHVALWDPAIAIAVARVLQREIEATFHAHSPEALELAEKILAERPEVQPGYYDLDRALRHLEVEE